LTGKRPEEQDVVRAQRREIEASLAMAETELKRQADLLPRGFTTRQAYDRPRARSSSCARDWRLSPPRSAWATSPRARPRSPPRRR